jgi:galactonate dehydratase
MEITEIKTLLVGRWQFVKIETDEGTYGVGEGGGWPYVSRRAVKVLKRKLVGKNPFEIERLWYMMYKHFWGHGVVGVVGGGAISGIDMALWDIKGKALNIPVYELLGGKVRDKIRVYGHADSPKKAQWFVDNGYTAFKCPASIEIIKELRDAVGYDIDIGLHSHGDFTPSAAIRLGRKAERYEPTFFEEPVPPENIEAMAKVAQHIDIPLATGERFFNKWCFTELISRQIIDIFQPEITRIGGITEQVKVSRIAEAQYITIAPHNGSAGPIAEAANIQICANLPNFLFLEHHAFDPKAPNADVPYRNEVVIGVIPDHNGYIEIPDIPGLGVDINEEECLQHPKEFRLSSEIPLEDVFTSKLSWLDPS